MPALSCHAFYWWQQSHGASVQNRLKVFLLGQYVSVLHDRPMPNSTKVNSLPFTTYCNLPLRKEVVELKCLIHSRWKPVVLWAILGPLQPLVSWLWAILPTEAPKMSSSAGKESDLWSAKFFSNNIVNRRPSVSQGYWIHALGSSGCTAMSAGAEKKITRIEASRPKIDSKYLCETKSDAIFIRCWLQSVMTRKKQHI